MDHSTTTSLIGQFFQGYLYAYIVWVGLTLGCQGLMLLQYVVKANWGVPVIRLLESGARCILLMAVLFIPILLAVWMGELYPWANAAIAREDKLIQAKAAYLNPGFFTIRAVLYFVIWGFLAYRTSGWSRAQDKSGDATLTQKRTDLAAFGMLVHVITVTFAFTDWVMSLDPHWFSTIYGVWFVVGQSLAGIAFVTLIAVRKRGQEPYIQLVDPQLTKDLGNLMLALTMLWGYTTLSQYLIIWSANLPEEITYFLRRNELFWQPLGVVVLVGQFFAPFLMLLSGRTKRTPDYLIGVASLVLVMRLLDLFWNIMRFYGTNNPTVYAIGIIGVVVVGSLWYFLGFDAQRKQAPLLPQYDIREVPASEAVHHA